MANVVAELKDLHTYFNTEEGVVKSVNGVSLVIHEGQTVAIVGESGCGKSVTALSIMGLIDEPAGQIVSGEILFDGRNLVKTGRKELERIRGKEIAMIFQEPMSALNPVLSIGDQVSEALIEHLHLSKKAAWQKAEELIASVGIPRAKEILKAYPHELSGGMLQRVVIAIAVSCNPRLLIADEPTTALDVTIQAQILDLLMEMKRQLDMSILLITHDLGVVAEVADYVVVMYGGKVIEQASVLSLFQNPQHPYTISLLKAKPDLGQRKKRLYAIPGQVPNPLHLGKACHFMDRCAYSKDICREGQPELEEIRPGHLAACWLYEEEKADVRTARSG
ncbi:ABC transporter ATP-binding protein [Paenibacillus sp. HWE-109]|uniref:ABC transporter ATP-binding protein n=1 Tax=Paenibacillus sp. HWE-109 TaxID=1306526 RepID=UPI001EDD8B30|nr:ABC transporter ATP-binding protein [Paenibacillus sp. HWE-109]UKS24722.1 ABC transporter ATP-binding protein [Paenibacillus sp. HWE-109]